MEHITLNTKERLSLIEPDLNKCSDMEMIYDQIDEGKCDAVRAHATDKLVLTREEYIHFCWNLLEPAAEIAQILKGNGGHFKDEDDEWTCNVIAVCCEGAPTLYINPEGYEYARYVFVERGFLSFVSKIEDEDVLASVAGETVMVQTRERQKRETKVSQRSETDLSRSETEVSHEDGLLEERLSVPTRVLDAIARVGRGNVRQIVKCLLSWSGYTASEVDMTLLGAKTREACRMLVNQGYVVRDTSEKVRVYYKIAG